MAFGSKKTNRIIAPVISQALIRQKFATDKALNRQEFHRRHTHIPNTFQKFRV